MYDLFIQNGNIIDPVAYRIYNANLCIKDGNIQEITCEKREAVKVIDAGGQFISPGFIDIHAHIEGNPRSGVLMAQQGVTTVVNGNCGDCPENPYEFIDDQNRKGFMINQLELVGATWLRMNSNVVDPFLPMGKKELDKANRILDEFLRAGYAGLSFGLEYCPGASIEEVMTLSRTAASHGKLVAVHTRTDGYAGMAALHEAIDINRITGASVQISHVAYQYGYGMMEQALQIIDDAVGKGLDISCDSGMYTSFATGIGTEVFNPECLDKWKCSYYSIVAASGPNTGQRMTKKIYENYRRNYPDEIAIALVGCPEEIGMAFELPYMMVSSDAGVTCDKGNACCHPQDAGTFPCFVDQLVKKTGKLALIDAVRRMTILPARRMKLANKGHISVGCDADLTIFDLEHIIDHSVFPHEGRCDALPEGISYVIVGGHIVVENQCITSDKAGKAIKC